MKDCCEVMSDVPAEQRRVLLIVFWINSAMFLVEFGAGLLADSTALLADSVDMLGDAFVYGFSLYVVSRGILWQARASMLKGLVMAGFALGVLGEALVKVARGGVPSPDLMGGVGLLALTVNLACLVLLWRRRTDDINMRSAWLCSRNDVAANVGVLVAAAGVAATGSAWPDIAVGLVIAAMFGSSSVRVLLDARRALGSPRGGQDSLISSARRTSRVPGGPVIRSHTVSDPPDATSSNVTNGQQRRSFAMNRASASIREPAKRNS
jgi:cation diffusion facilitator family transporter